jgi:hypothetical protein
MIPDGLANPAQSAVDADLASTRFKAGDRCKYWHVVSYTFPVLIMAVAAVEPEGTASEYFFHFELSGFPGTAPAVQIWDCATNDLLAENRRPKGSDRVVAAFKNWAPHNTVYRPWERASGAHNNWAQAHPNLAWNPKREIAFILEDLHGLLTSNAAARGSRPAPEAGL